MPNTSLTNEQKVQLTVTPLTAGGKSALVNGAPLWSSSNVGVATLVIAPDGMSAYVIAAGVGTSTISVTADANLSSPPVQPISSSITVTVTSAPASSLSIVIGTPVSQ
jgi:hypothetical protein